MTHAQYDSMTMAERAALDALEDLKLPENAGGVELLISRSLNRPDKFLELLSTLRDMAADNPEYLVGIIPDSTVLLIVQAVDEKYCDCEGYCYHETMT